MAIDKYLEFKADKSIVTKSSEIIVTIPTSYRTYKLLRITDFVYTLAVFEFKVAEEKEPQGLFLPATIEMCPTDTKYITMNGDEYAQLTFKKGDTFIRNRQVVQNAYIAYVIFTEYIEKGKVPSYMKYDQLSFLFDTLIRVTQCKIPAEHAVFEIMFAHLSRDRDNLLVPYRHTPMTNPPYHLKLTNVAQAAQSVTAKLTGSYLNDSLTTSLINEAEHASDIEELLRQ